MDMNRHYSNRDPELVFLDELIAFVKTVNARTAMLIAEIDHVKKVIANEPQPDAEASHQSHQGE
jgi:hypothetical protein